jgi:lysophospholipase L1-like esterase
MVQPGSRIEQRRRPLRLRIRRRRARAAAIALLVLGAVGLVWVTIGPGDARSLQLLRAHTSHATSARPASVSPALPPSYVALGDSYTSGPGVGQPEPGGSACGRSLVNYPHLVAEELDLSLTDASCGGATVADVTGAQSTLGGIVPPQLDAIGPDTAVVTVSLGGDDIGFSSIIANCVALTPIGPTRVGTTCAGHYAPSGNDQLAAAVSRTATSLGAALDGVHAAAPRAVVLVVGYPAILPPSGACWPWLPFTNADAGYLRGVEQHLNTMMAATAALHGARFVDLGPTSSGHDACAGADQRWIEPLEGANGTPVHPNKAGEAAMATAVAQAMRDAGVR